MFRSFLKSSGIYQLSPFCISKCSIWMNLNNIKWTFNIYTLLSNTCLNFWLSNLNIFKVK